ncbi:GntR family transcriptional regulator [Nocardioides campestrisoli]|uniref:GntR family transcriptional regulator n=1 Tax=Nocardioides campestrisoli TaxID=2736757 RepID=UPI00163D4C47|nr:GntR family transcriptional regulator [Nocardioides campestrisoli]
MRQGYAAGVVSEQLSEWITEGRLAPEAKVSEAWVAGELQVSRNTVREAFRLLAHDGLLVHEFNRGVFVAPVTAADVRDVYRVRRIIETAVVRSLQPDDRHRLGALAELVGAARTAAGHGDWVEVGTANMRFHRALVALAGSPRLDLTMRRLAAELRLVFAVSRDPQRFFEPFVERNSSLVDLMAADRFEQAADYLDRYLADSERAILAAFADRAPTLD